MLWLPPQNSMAAKRKGNGMKNLWNKIPKWARRWIVFIALAYIGFHLMCPSGTWRYKVTVNVETPEGIKTGSAVREFSNCACWINLIDFPEAGNPPDHFKGEAVVIDLGKRGVAFAVMGTDDYYMYYNAFPVDGASTPKGILEMNAMGHKEKTLSLKDFPLIVTFKDMNDPKSVEAVKPDNLAAVFGAGVHLKDITIETTKESVTWGVEKYLGPWHAVGPYEFVKGR